MSPLLNFAAIAVAGVGSLYFTSLTYALRELSRARLSDYFDKTGDDRWLEPTMEKQDDLILVTAIGRMFCNLFILLTILVAFSHTGWAMWQQYLSAVIVAAIYTGIVSVALPHALARHIGHAIVGQSVRFLHLMRVLLAPLTALLLWVDKVVSRMAGGDDPEVESDQFEQEILSAVEEGQKEGIVGEQEREMIESVISFRDTTTGQIMTARPEVVGIDIGATLDQVKQMLEESGHSRLPVFRGTLDQIVGILYARDLLKHLGLPADKFDIKSAMRPAFYVPETKPLSDLLNDFRLQKVHLAVVLDEYGGTAGLITIEDILEELVGDISDEHEPAEPAMMKRLDDQTWEADARVYIDELNRVTGTSLPEDAGYDTLGGFVSTTMGRIPETGATFESENVKFTVLDAEPQKVNRVKIEFALQPAEGPTGL
ncbi:MAG TPA: hemolysin family protein [Tepidisphaeraceae bacterium]|jgi:CBS domain containing-hemolysin-like protein|nr:hemolysin family protein [Tepidisphaeraceae bacterium]